MGIYGGMVYVWVYIPYYILGGLGLTTIQPNFGILLEVTAIFCFYQSPFLGP